MASVILSTEDVRPFFRVGTKTRSLLTVVVFPFRLRPHPANALASLTDDDGSTSHYRHSFKKARP